MKKSPTNNLLDIAGLQQENEHFIWIDMFDDEALRSFYRAFSRLENDPSVGIIPIIISSYGGECYTMIAMRDLIKSSHKPVATIALGKAMSSGAFLLASGTKGYRFASDDSYIMIHEVSSGMEGKSNDIKEQAMNVENLNKKMFTNFCKDTGFSYKDLMKEISHKRNADMYLTAEEAKNRGIIDHVGVPRIVPGAHQTQLVLADLPKKDTPKTKSSKKK